MRALLLILVVLPLVHLSACSKKNTIDMSSDIVVGPECAGPGDAACGKDGACVLGYCRVPCDGDDDCPKGALCIGTTGNLGCQLTWDAFCNASQPCKPGLACAKDHTCRMPCSVSPDCPRGDQECIDEVCVGTLEPGATDAGAD